MSTSAIVGYARTSTRDQHAGLEAQIAELTRAGCTKTFVEQVSSVRKSERHQLEAALSYVREGDTFVITKIDRLARSLAHLLELVSHLQRKGVSLRILSMNVDTATAQGKLMLNVLGSVAEFERELMLERQADGIAAAKAAGKYKGRAPTARRRAGEIRQLATAGVPVAVISRQLNVSKASVYRMLSPRQQTSTSAPAQELTAQGRHRFGCPEGQ